MVLISQRESKIISGSVILSKDFIQRNRVTHENISVADRQKNKVRFSRLCYCFEQKALEDKPTLNFLSYFEISIKFCVQRFYFCGAEQEVKYLLQYLFNVRLTDELFRGTIRRLLGLKFFVRLKCLSLWLKRRSDSVTRVDLKK